MPPTTPPIEPWQEERPAYNPDRAARQNVRREAWYARSTTSSNKPRKPAKTKSNLYLPLTFQNPKNDFKPFLTEPSPIPPISTTPPPAYIQGINTGNIGLDTRPQNYPGFITPKQIIHDKAFTIPKVLRSHYLKSNNWTDIFLWNFTYRFCFLLPIILSVHRTSYRIIDIGHSDYVFWCIAIPNIPNVVGVNFPRHGKQTDRYYGKSERILPVPRVYYPFLKYLNIYTRALALVFLGYRDLDKVLRLPGQLFERPSGAEQAYLTSNDIAQFALYHFLLREEFSKELWNTSSVSPQGIVHPRWISQVLHEWILRLMHGFEWHGVRQRMNIIINCELSYNIYRRFLWSTSNSFFFSFSFNIYSHFLIFT